MQTGKEDKKEKILFAGNILFWLGILCEMIVMPSGYLIGGYHENLIIVAGMGCFSLSLLCTMELKRDWKVFVPLFAFALLAYYFQRSALILRVVLILLSGRRMEREKICKAVFFATAFWIVAALVLAFTGGAGPLYEVGSFRHLPWERRYGFGFLHPNGFCFFWIRMVALGMYLYSERLRLWQRLLLYGFALLPLLLSKSKIALAMLAVMVALDLYRQHRKDKERMLRVITYGGGALLMAELLLIYTLGILPYPQVNLGNVYNLWDLMNEVTTGRLWQARELLQTQGVSLMGQHLPAPVNEIGFINMLYHEGVIFSAFYVLMLFWLLQRLFREKDARGMILMLVFSYYAMAESFLSYFNKNAVWLLLIAGLPAFMMPVKRAEKNEKDDKD